MVYEKVYGIIRCAYQDKGEVVMYAFKVTVTVLLAILIIISGYVTVKEEDRSTKWVGLCLGIVLACAIAAIWV